MLSNSCNTRNWSLIYPLAMNYDKSCKQTHADHWPTLTINQFLWAVNEFKLSKCGENGSNPFTFSSDTSEIWAHTGAEMCTSLCSGKREPLNPIHELMNKLIGYFVWTMVDGRLIRNSLLWLGSIFVTICNNFQFPSSLGSFVGIAYELCNTPRHPWNLSGSRVKWQLVICLVSVMKCSPECADDMCNNDLYLINSQSSLVRI